MSGPRLNPRLFEIPQYIAGKSAEQVKEELGLDDVIKMASNESPIGPSPMAVEAARRMLDIAHHYPGISDRDLRKKLANRLDGWLDENNILMGNGGTDILRMVAQSFVFEGGNTIMSRVTFPMYRILTTTFGSTPRFIETTHDYHQDVARMAEKVDNNTSLIFLCSPNNPTGEFIYHSEAEKLLSKLPDHVVVVFDESYHDYITDPRAVDTLVLIKNGLNVFSVRSFSKIAGLANLRVGYLIGQTNLVDYVRRTQLPFNVGDIALAAAAASLDDEDYHKLHKKAVLEGRDYLYSTLCQMNMKCLPSHANFLTVVDPPIPVPTLVESLLRKGVIVRGMDTFGMPNAFRVSVGTPEMNQLFIATLKRVVEEEPQFV